MPAKTKTKAKKKASPRKSTLTRELAAAERKRNIIISRYATQYEGLYARHHRSLQSLQRARDISVAEVDRRIAILKARLSTP